MQEKMTKQSVQIDKLLQQAADSTKQILQLAEQNSKLAKSRFDFRIKPSVSL